MDVSLRLHLPGDVDAQIHSGDGHHYHVEGDDQADDQREGLRRRLLGEGVEVSEFGHARCRGAN